MVNVQASRLCQLRCISCCWVDTNTEYERYFIVLINVTIIYDDEYGIDRLSE